MERANSLVEDNAAAMANLLTLIWYELQDGWECDDKDCTAGAALERIEGLFIGMEDIIDSHGGHIEIINPGTKRPNP